MPPRISVVTPVYNPPLGALLACIEAMVAQTFTDWQWCLVDDCSTRPEVAEALTQAAAREPRIVLYRRPVNGGIVAASNDGLHRATGEFVALLDHDDLLVPDALSEVIATLDGEGGDDIDYLYTDELHVMADGRPMAPFPKPAWSPERFRASMYTCHLSVLRRCVIEAIGGFRDGFDGSQDHDLILRATEHITAADRRIVHLPMIAYHWRHITSSVSREQGSLSAAVNNGRRAVQEQCDRLAIAADVVHGPVPGTYRVVRREIERATVTVVVTTAFEPATTRPNRSAVEATVRSIAASTDAVRFVVAHRAAGSPTLIDLLDNTLPAHWLRLPVEGAWSPAAAIDRALEAYPADVVVSIAPGLTARTDETPDWLGALTGLACSLGAGLVGGLIADDSDAVLHAGWDEPPYRLVPLEGQRVGAPTSGNDLLIERECSMVSLAVAACTAANWREARHAARGGWNRAGRAVSSELAAHGCRTLFTPYARFDRTVPIDD